MDNLHTDFSDGLKLIELVQCVSKKEVFGNRQSSTSRAGKLENVESVLKFLEGEKVSLVDISEFYIHSNVFVTFLSSSPVCGITTEGVCYFN